MFSGEKMAIWAAGAPSARVDEVDRVRRSVHPDRSAAVEFADSEGVGERASELIGRFRAHRRDRAWNAGRVERELARIKNVFAHPVSAREKPSAVDAVDGSGRGVDSEAFLGVPFAVQAEGAALAGRSGELGDRAEVIDLVVGRRVGRERQAALVRVFGAAFDRVRNRFAALRVPDDLAARAVEVVEDREISGAVDGDPAGQVEGASVGAARTGLDAAVAPTGLQDAVFVVLADRLAGELGDVDVALRWAARVVDRDQRRLAELLRSTAVVPGFADVARVDRADVATRRFVDFVAEHEDEAAVGSELLDPVVPRFGDVDVAVRGPARVVDRHRGGEADRVGSRAFDRARAHMAEVFGRRDRREQRERRENGDGEAGQADEAWVGDPQLGSPVLPLGHHRLPDLLP